jgi:diadenosine tetraphosphate (Ap4A) HIT family hydrolase
MAATETKNFNILQNNGAIAHQAVQHVHFHIIPKHEDGSGLAFVWRSTQLGGGAALAELIASKL